MVLAFKVENLKTYIFLNEKESIKKKRTLKTQNSIDIMDETFMVDSIIFNQDVTFMVSRRKKKEERRRRKKKKKEEERRNLYGFKEKTSKAWDPVFFSPTTTPGNSRLQNGLGPHLLENTLARW